MVPLSATIAAGITILMMAGPLRGAAADDAVDWSSFVQAHAARRTSDTDCPVSTVCDVPFNDQRLQLKAEGGNQLGTVAFLGKLDLIHDAVIDESDVEPRELYADYFSDRFSLRAGRQIVTWGVGDFLFINDIFPKDWVAFYQGLPFEYLKLGSDALKLNLYLGSTTLVVVVSDFRADRLPNAERFVLASPIPADLPQQIERPDEPELALKLSGQLGRWDAALYASRGYYHTPALVQTATEVRGSYPRLNTFGASLSGAFGNGVLNLEAGYYHSADDPGGTDPAIENSQTRLLAGYSRQLGQDTVLGVQVYGEWMQDYSAYRRTLSTDFPVRDRVRTVATLRLTQTYWYQTLTFNLFTFWGVSEDDAYVIPSVRYAFSDHLWAELGANIFSGDRNGMFGALKDNDNVYLTVRYAF